jgi:hypothetical protein
MKYTKNVSGLDACRRDDPDALLFLRKDMRITINMAHMASHIIQPLIDKFPQTTVLEWIATPEKVSDRYKGMDLHLFKGNSVLLWIPSAVSNKVISSMKSLVKSLEIRPLDDSTYYVTWKDWTYVDDSFEVLGSKKISSKSGED